MTAKIDPHQLTNRALLVDLDAVRTNIKADDALLAPLRIRVAELDDQLKQRRKRESALIVSLGRLNDLGDAVSEHDIAAAMAELALLNEPLRLGPWDATALVAS